jgi:hypothetical protein
MKKTPIGHVACPVCDFPDAQVKEDKNNHAYIHCTDCNAQTFTRNDFRNGKLRGRMRAVTVTVADDTVTVTAPAPAAVPPPPAIDKVPPVKKPGGWFQPLLAQG